MSHADKHYRPRVEPHHVTIPFYAPSEKFIGRYARAPTERMADPLESAYGWSDDGQLLESEHLPNRVEVLGFYVTTHSFRYYGFFKPTLGEVLRSILRVSPDVLDQKDIAIVMLSTPDSLHRTGLEDHHLACCAVVSLGEGPRAGGVYLTYSPSNQPHPEIQMTHPEKPEIHATLSPPETDALVTQEAPADVITSAPVHLCPDHTEILKYCEGWRDLGLPLHLIDEPGVMDAEFFREDGSLVAEYWWLPDRAETVRVGQFGALREGSVAEVTAALRAHAGEVRVSRIPNRETPVGESGAEDSTSS